MVNIVNKKNSCVAFGVFDGVHKGHIAIIERLARESLEAGLAPVLLRLVFSPPSSFGRRGYLTPGGEADSLIECAWRSALARAGGDVRCVDCNVRGSDSGDSSGGGGANYELEIVTAVITPADANINPEQFIERFPVGMLGAKIIVAGENCRFGHGGGADSGGGDSSGGGGGGVGTLLALSEKFNYIPVIVKAERSRTLFSVQHSKEAAEHGCEIENSEVAGAMSAAALSVGALSAGTMSVGALSAGAMSAGVYSSGGIIESDSIRRALSDKNIELANDMLGCRYSLRGEVVAGKALGRGSNMPTANILVPPDKFLPAHGVYVTVSRVNGAEYHSLTNIGTRPTVDDSDSVTIESHLLDFTGDLYSQTMEIELHRYIRGIRRFGSLDEVRAQVDSDIIQARSYFRSVLRQDV